MIITSMGTCTPAVACKTVAGLYCALNAEITSVVGSKYGGSVYVVSTAVEDSFEGETPTYCTYNKEKNVKYNIAYTLSIGVPQPSQAPTLSPTIASSGSVSQDSTLPAVVTVKNVQYYVILLSFFIYAMMGALVVRAREKDDKLVQLGLLDVSLTMGVMGVSLASEMFYVCTLFLSGSADYIACAAAILAVRVCHCVPAASVIVSILEPLGIRGVYASNVDTDAIFANDYFYGVITLMSLLDFYIITLLPWKKSHFAEKSFGFPSFGIFRTSVYLTVAQTLISSAIQIYVLTSQEGRASSSYIIFAGVNLSLTVVSMLVAVIKAFLKINILVKYRGDSSPTDCEVQQQISLACVKDALQSSIARLCKKVSRLCSRLVSPISAIRRIRESLRGADRGDVEMMHDRGGTTRISNDEPLTRISISTDFSSYNPMQRRSSAGGAGRVAAASAETGEALVLRTEQESLKVQLGSVERELQEMKLVMAQLLKASAHRATDDLEL